MTQNYNSLQELFNDFPWKTPSKFIPLAKRFGFTNENEIKLLNFEINSCGFLNIFAKSHQFSKLSTAPFIMHVLI